MITLYLSFPRLDIEVFLYLVEGLHMFEDMYMLEMVGAGNGRRIGLVVPCDYNEHLLQGNVSDLNQVIIVSVFKG